eukprot:m51a1_g1040 hypothetical protein (75) ;mRNA; r:715039-718018
MSIQPKMPQHSLQSLEVVVVVVLLVVPVELCTLVSVTVWATTEEHPRVLEGHLKDPTACAGPGQGSSSSSGLQQ